MRGDPSRLSGEGGEAAQGARPETWGKPKSLKPSGSPPRIRVHSKGYRVRKVPTEMPGFSGSSFSQTVNPHEGLGHRRSISRCIVSQASSLHSKSKLLEESGDGGNCQAFFLVQERDSPHRRKGRCPFTCISPARATYPFVSFGITLAPCHATLGNVATYYIYLILK